MENFITAWGLVSLWKENRGVRRPVFGIGAIGGYSLRAMRWNCSAAVVLCAVALGACARPKLATKAASPSLEKVVIGNEEKSPMAFAGDTAKGFLRPCQTVLAGGGVVELVCGEHQVVEFRKGASTGESEEDLHDVMEVLAARFGELQETRHDAMIDDFPVRVSDFRTVKEGVAGIAVAVGNSQGRYWVFACYKKKGGANQEFCQEAIASAARAGGLAYVEAKKLQGFGEGKLKVGKGCVSSEESSIRCESGQLSWSPIGSRSAELLQQEAVARIDTMAVREKVEVVKEKRLCQLLGKSAECLHLHILNEGKGDELHFVLAKGGEQERLVVCSFSAFDDAALPEPCSQILTLEPKSP